MHMPKADEGGGKSSDEEEVERELVGIDYHIYTAYLRPRNEF
jgi:hypothetical protein